LNIIWADNGAEAVELFQQHGDIALVLMDIRMPIMDGYQAAKQMLSLKPNARIIAQTANAMTGDREKCLQNGFIDYIPKPIQNDKLIEIIAKWIFLCEMISEP
jgi:two-component system CheB/CheR fusion protein